MNRIKLLAICLIGGVANLFGFGSSVCGNVVGGDRVVIDGSKYSVEGCDGVEVVGQGLDYTYYIFKDREIWDIANQKRVTVDDMNYLIDHVVNKHPDSCLAGEGKAFIRASNQTGLDPIFLLSLVGIESWWGTNKTHLNLCNLYSIGMYGDGSRSGEDLGDSVEEGIIAGAKFVYEEYYLRGQTSVYDMNHVDGHSYCDGDVSWETQIVSEMDFLNGLLENR